MTLDQLEEAIKLGVIKGSSEGGTLYIEDKAPPYNLVEIFLSELFGARWVRDLLVIASVIILCVVKINLIR